MNWEDHYFIVRTSGKWAGYRHMANDPGFIIVDRRSGEDPRQVVFRDYHYALRSVKRLMQRDELIAELTLLGKLTK